jgi:Ca-activated chloride channel homolog
MSVAQPWILIAAFAVATAFVAAAVAGLRRSRAAALDYSSLPFLEGTLGRGIPWTSLFVAAWALAILGVGVALAKPSIVSNVPVGGAAVVLCIDTSGSMASTDVVPTRAAASRAAATAFIDGVPAGTRLAIVAFAANAIPLGDLTDDRDAVHDQLDRLPAPNGGTAIGDALAVAAQLLPTGGRRAIVLVTDGVNNHGSDPLSVAAEVGARGIAIDTVGIGTNGSGQLIPGTGEDAELDEEALREIAASGHGTYARVADARGLRERLESLGQTSVRERRRIDLALPFAIGGGVLALAVALAAIVVGRFP